MSEASYTSTADSNARSSHLSPNAVGDWILGRKLGKGTQGTVRLGQHSRTKELCAIKIIARKPEYQQGVPLPRTPQEAQQASLKIQREIVLMKLIDHPNLIKMRDVWESKRELFVVMEYIDGIQLFEYVCHNGALGTPDALHIFQQLVSAVSYCHKFNITHRDLKLENIMITPSHTIKIVDFGLAAWGAVEGKVLETSCGSPHYASPEVVSGETYRGDLADVWSCGVIFYALLVGRLPFDEQDGGGVEEVLEKVRRGVFHMPARLDHWAKDLLSRMLEKDVAKRITMDHIEQHPFYLAYPQRAIPGRPAPPTTEAIDQLIVDEASLDAILFKNMEALWPRRPAHEIKSRLLLAGCVALFHPNVSYH
ncbi:hypothetical protein BOTBODRAFT_120940 [Botryobasidium botryosum FD-172 SS1]|uniref:Protein kinase domain-containing protein n=1 Tax=Botryobasidium botryosum (strain FD-172 SS1) TaxID=930990 RepID=A0A067M4T5_BOTB1|nr:hypothetical protein BOTBODRAFT_120940 [Botryobasidium botryosum FD-172 SS1]